MTQVGDEGGLPPTAPLLFLCSPRGTGQPTVNGRGLLSSICCLTRYVRSFRVAELRLIDSGSRVSDSGNQQGRSCEHGPERAWVAVDSFLEVPMVTTPNGPPLNMVSHLRCACGGGPGQGRATERRVLPPSSTNPYSAKTRCHRLIEAACSSSIPLFVMHHRTKGSSGLVVQPERMTHMCDSDSVPTQIRPSARGTAAPARYNEPIAMAIAFAPEHGPVAGPSASIGVAILMSLWPREVTVMSCRVLSTVPGQHRFSELLCNPPSNEARMKKTQHASTSQYPPLKDRTTSHSKLKIAPTLLPAHLPSV
eukprot:CAMPEP_0174307520 /NCGR_PEP_ID=MMETSP0810-20121108/1170_1 /TAXON_ID=73025 ORGANISM="Eutreptiella gymnastica-like, Strain CCMP1594" /NCGR_SAMPLE_ID=MMETSP0810 /ASSEMBLY_ACC=CAM_ASM_000659 /LENGTH=307 /DNA_ID=CAMNT_0015414591 /DNA_START=829 /DNA_END=1753 /DNA_ORIENTATION=+